LNGTLSFRKNLTTAGNKKANEKGPGNAEAFVLGSLRALT